MLLTLLVVARIAVRAWLRRRRIARPSRAAA
jgi:hypothetical protein